MASVLELVVVASMSVFLIAVMITLLMITTRMSNNTASKTDARREFHSTLDTVMSELRNARGLATCLDEYEDGFEPTSTAQCRKVKEGAAAINQITDGGRRFCFFSYGVGVDDSAQRTLGAPGQVCLAALDNGDERWRLELERWESPSNNYFEFGSGVDETAWLGAAAGAFATPGATELVGYVAQERDGIAVDPFTFLDGQGSPVGVAGVIVGAGSPGETVALGGIRVVDVALTVPYDVKRQQATADDAAETKYFSYTATVALRGALYEGEQTWNALG